MIRLSADGSPDASFGEAGIALIRLFRDVAVQPDGGAAFTFTGRRGGGGFPIGLGRLTASGEPESAVGVEGTRVFGFGPTSNATPEIIVRPDGGLVTVAGNIVLVLDRRGRPGARFGRDGAARLPGRAVVGLTPLVDHLGRLVVHRGQRFGAPPSPTPSPSAGLTLRLLRAPLVTRERGERAEITLTARQLLTNQRIAQAAVRRVNALQALVDGENAPAGGGGDPRAVELSAGQLRISQRIAQAAVHRINSLTALVDGEPEPKRDAVRRDRVAPSVAQLRINQRIAQAAIRRADVLAGRIPDLPVPRPPENTPMDGIVGVAVAPRKVRVLQVRGGPGTVGATVALVLPPELRAHALRDGETISAAGVSSGSTFFGFHVSIESAPAN